jgi:adenylosuccinate synthase
LARDCKELSSFIQDVPDSLRDSLERHERVVIEGTQGFGLSPLHARHYPYVTSRDTTAAAFLSETGLSPLDVDDIVLTIRAFPIRVGSKNAGPLEDEIDWDTITREGDHLEALEELTSVTQKVRRVGRFSSVVVKQAIRANKPTRIVLNHLDYLLSEDAALFLRDTEIQIAHNICLVGTSRKDVLDSRSFSLLNLS